MQIHITRLEGRSEECDITHTFSTFEQAEHALFVMSASAPRTGGYNKVRFVVDFGESRTYDGRVDLQYWRKPRLRDQMCYHLRSYSDPNSLCYQLTVRNGDDITARQRDAQVMLTQILNTHNTPPCS